MAISPFLAALGSKAPPADRVKEMHLYGWLIGSWEMNAVHHLDDGTAEESTGEIHFGWVLEGRAIQDIWIRPRRPAPSTMYGTTLRIFDPGIGAGTSSGATRSTRTTRARSDGPGVRTSSRSARIRAASTRGGVSPRSPLTASIGSAGKDHPQRSVASHLRAFCPQNQSLILWAGPAETGPTASHLREGAYGSSGAGRDGQLLAYKR